MRGPRGARSERRSSGEAAALIAPAYGLAGFRAVVALLALWVAAVIIPVALGAAVVAWGLWRYRVWRAGG